MPTAANEHQVVITVEEAPSSGVRRRTLSTSRTMEMPAVEAPWRPSIVRKVRVEQCGMPTGMTANDGDSTSFLINTGDLNSTSYRFVAPRLGRRTATR